MLSTRIVSLTLLFASFASALPALDPECTPELEAWQSIYVLPPEGDAIYRWAIQLYIPGGRIAIREGPATEYGMDMDRFRVVPYDSGLYGIVPDVPVTNDVPPTLLTAFNDGSLIFTLTGKYSPNLQQQFNLTCRGCFGPTECIIQYPVTGQCVVGSNVKDIVRLGSCNGAGTYYFGPFGITPVRPPFHGGKR